MTTPNHDTTDDTADERNEPSSGARDTDAGSACEPTRASAQPTGDEPGPRARPPVRVPEWLVWIALALVTLVILLPPVVLADPGIAREAASVNDRLGGDVKRTLETLQQFGDFATMALIICVILLLDRARVRRTLDWLFASGVGILIFNAMKLGIGRLRPDYAAIETAFADARASGEAFAGHLRFFAWETEAALADSRSFALPSTHTTHAFIAAVFLCAMYPRLKPLVFGLAALVGCCRVLFGAHWASDVVAGAVLGSVWAYLCTKHYLGVRFVDLVWKLTVDRNATPAYPQVREREEAALCVRT